MGKRKIILNKINTAKIRTRTHNVIEQYEFWQPDED